MKKLILIIAIFLSVQFSFAQIVKENDQKEIEKVVNEFMKSFVDKDSVKFQALFHKDPVVWIGVFKDKTQFQRKKKNPNVADYNQETYKTFFKGLYKMGAIEEKFYNLKIINDDKIASVNFDFELFENGKKLTWGKEIWGLIKTNGEWKITTVLFSL
jgi:hypothetical protein